MIFKCFSLSLFVSSSFQVSSFMNRHEQIKKWATWLKRCLSSSSSTQESQSHVSRNNDSIQFYFLVLAFMTSQSAKVQEKISISLASLRNTQVSPSVNWDRRQWGT
jgi:hypothetical protein